MAPRKKLKAKNTETCSIRTMRTRKTNTSESSVPSEKPLLKRLHKKSQNIVTVKVSPFPKQAISVITDDGTKEIAKCTDLTPKDESHKSNESNAVRQGIRRLNMKNRASQFVPAMNQVAGTTSLLPVAECTIVKKRKGKPRIKKSPVQETARDLNNDHKTESKNEEELAPTIINSEIEPLLKKKSMRKQNIRESKRKTQTAKKVTKNKFKSTLAESKATLQIEKRQEIDTNCQRMGDKRKRKPSICNSNIKDMKRQKVNRTNYNLKVNDSNMVAIEKAATIIEQRLADSKQNMLSSDVVSTCASKGVIDKLHTVKRRATKIPLEPDPCRTFASLKKRERKKKSLESVSCETFASHASSSISDTFSWTKEISSSSASFVTVTSNDYVCIDRKLPIIKLYNVERSSPDTTVKIPEQIKMNTKKITSLSETDTESSAEYSKHRSRITNLPSNVLECSSNHQLNDFIQIPKTSHPTLDLSTTTSPSQIPSTTEVTTENDTDVTSDTDISKSKFIEKYLDNIQPHFERETANKDMNETILKRVDLDFIECLGIGNTQVVDINDKSYKACSKFLNAEIATIDECQIIKKQLSQFLFNNKENSQENVLYYHDYLDRQSTPAEENTSKESDNENMPHTNDAHTLLEDSNGNKKILDASGHNYDDDDDTLSLFAESIDLNKFNHSVMNEKNQTKISDEPSQTLHNAKAIEQKYEDQIQNDEQKSKDTKTNKESMHSKTKLICEKQNADSTSLNKEDKVNKDEEVFVDHAFSQNKDTFELSDSYSKISERQAKGSEAGDNSSIKLMNSYCSARNPIKSSIFCGVCFFNLSHICKHINCYFLHRDLPPTLVKMRLEQQGNMDFMQEYMLARKFSKLREKYVYLFIENCAKRNLPRVLMEMAIDSILKDTIKTRIPLLETILLAFNDINMNVCKDMLFYKFEANCLCDIFLQTIVFNQNFTRFISVFIKLVNAKIDKHSYIEISIAFQILERVCILAYNERLIESVLRVFSHTDPEIFSHSLLNRFEAMLLQINRPLYEKLNVMKNAAMSPSDSLTKECSPIQMQTCINLITNSPLPQGINDNKRYTSPDTTLLDSMNKINDELALYTNNNATMESTLFFSQSKPRETIVKPSKFQFRNDKFYRPNITTEENTFFKQAMHSRSGNLREDINWCLRANSRTRLVPESSVNQRFVRPNFNGTYKRQF